MTATVVEIGDRLDALNQRFSAEYNQTAKRPLTTRRLWPQNFRNEALHPLLVPIFGDWQSAGRRPQMGAGAGQGTRTWTLMIVVGLFELGIPSESAHHDSEVLIDRLPTFYRRFPSLLLDGDGLPGVVRSEIYRSRGITSIAANVDVAVLRFLLEVTTLDKTGSRFG